MPDPIPTVSSLWLRPFIDTLESAGVDVDPLLEAAHLPQDARYREMLIAEQPVWAFIELGARETGIAGLGFRVAQTTGITSVGEFADRLAACPTLAHVVATLAAESPISEYRLVRLGGDLFLSRRGSPIRRGAWQVEQLIVTLMIQSVQRLAGPTWTPREVRLQAHSTPGVEESRYLGRSRVSTGQARTAVSIPPQLEPSAGPPGDPTTGSREACLADAEWLDTLARILEPHLADGYPGIELTARILDTSVRTLQRRLRAAGTTYSRIVARSRLEKATRLLRDTDLRMIDVAYRLGYSDPGSFSRAFLGWTGSTPREFRRSCRS